MRRSINVVSGCGSAEIINKYRDFNVFNKVISAEYVQTNQKRNNFVILI